MWLPETHGSPKAPHAHPLACPWRSPKGPHNYPGLSIDIEVFKAASQITFTPRDFDVLSGSPAHTKVIIIAMPMRVIAVSDLD